MISIVIFDLDGTLYDFRSNGTERAGFAQSAFYTEIKERAYAFLSKKQNMGRSQAIRLYHQIKERWNGEVSLGVESELGINRYEFFNEVWDIEPTQFVKKKNLSSFFSEVEEHRKRRIAVLTAAPRVWAVKVMAYLDVGSYENVLFTGEPDIRKPNPEAFNIVCKFLSARPQECVSIGDQIETDILPAKLLGMKTVLIGGDSSEADYSLKNVEEVPELLRRVS